MNKMDVHKILSKMKLLYIDNKTYDADWHSTLHSHPFTELFYVVKGSGLFRFGDNSTTPVKEDDMVIINPNLMHTEVSDPDNPLQYIVLGLDGIQFSTGNINDVDFSIHNYADYKHEILLYLKAIVLELEDSDDFSSIVTDNLLSILVANVVRRTYAELQFNEIDVEQNKDCVFIENYIKVHYQENITLDLLASLTFINKYYLSHIFKEHAGMSPIDFVLHIRLVEAQKLLRNTDLSISQIASIVGFGTSSYFSQYFKKTHEMSPSNYRKQYSTLKNPQSLLQ